MRARQSAPSVPPRRLRLLHAGSAILLAWSIGNLIAGCLVGLESHGNMQGDDTVVRLVDIHAVPPGSVLTTFHLHADTALPVTVWYSTTAPGRWELELLFVSPGGNSTFKDAGAKDDAVTERHYRAGPLFLRGPEDYQVIGVKTLHPVATHSRVFFNMPTALRSVVQSPHGLLALFGTTQYLATLTAMPRGAKEAFALWGRASPWKRLGGHGAELVGHLYLSMTIAYTWGHHIEGMPIEYSRQVLSVIGVAIFYGMGVWARLAVRDDVSARVPPEDHG